MLSQALRRAGSARVIALRRILSRKLTDLFALLQRIEARRDARLARLEQSVERLEEITYQLKARGAQEVKWRNILNRKMDATIRALYVDEPDELPYPYRVAVRRFQLRSQNEEDGIILALLREIRVSSRRFVDIGCGASGGNAGLFAYEYGWAGLMVDARAQAVREARSRFALNKDVVVARHDVTMENINPLLERHGFTGEVDLFSIDIDSHDYWLFKALKACSPRILVIEYNAQFGPDKRVTIPYRPLPNDAPKGYHGASLAALEKLARKREYRLVLCDNMGANAFFLRNDVGGAIPGLTPRDAYRPSLSRSELLGDDVRQLNIYDVIRERGLPLVEV